MIFNYYGLTRLPDGTQLNPGSLNTWLKIQTDGYINNGLVNWIALTRLSKLAKSINNSSFDALEFTRIPFNSTILTNDLKSNQPDILDLPGHFVVAKSIVGETFGINDPYYPSRTTLNDYGNTAKYLIKFTPSNTDLSYILITTRSDIQIDLKDNKLNSVGEFSIQDPIQNSENNNQMSGPLLKTYFLNRPNDKNYMMNISSNITQFYNLTLYFYDVNGNVRILNQKGIVGRHDSDKVSIKFDKNNLKKIQVKTKRVNFIDFFTHLNWL